MRRKRGDKHKGKKEGEGEKRGRKDENKEAVVA